MRVAFCSVLLVLGACSGRVSVETSPLAPEPVPVAVPIQHGFGGRVRETVSVSGADLDRVRALFEGVTDGRSERAAVGEAVAFFERLAGTQTPVHRDAPMNRGSGPGRQDCIDESANTTVWLRLLSGMGLLRHHEVGVIARRAPRVVDNHRSAVVVDRATGVSWVVDSWFGFNGEVPRIEPLEVWVRGGG